MRASILLLTGLLGAPSLAWAVCPAPFTTDDVLTGLGDVEEFLRNGDNAAAAAGAEKLKTGLGCLNEVLPSMITGRVYRAVAAGHIAGGDDLGGFDWYLTSLEVDPTFQYGIEDLTADHPARLSFEDAKLEIQGDPVPVGDKTLAGGVHYLDGRKLTVPAARLGRPHVYQHETNGVRSWLIENNDFPDSAFGGAAAVADAGESKPKKEKKPKAAKEPKAQKEPKAAKEPKETKAAKEPKAEKVAKVKEPKEPKEPKPEEEPDGRTDRTKEVSEGAVVLGRERPWEKTPLIVGGGLVIAGAGGLYAMSSMKHRDFQDATTKAEVEQYHDATNQLFIASVAVLAAGAGTLTWGIILDGQTPLPTVNFSF